MTHPGPRLPGRHLVRGTTVLTGLVTATTGWALPGPLWLRALAGVLAAGTVLGGAAVARILLRAVPGMRARGVLALVSAVLVSGVVTLPWPEGTASGIPGLTRAEVDAVLATPVTTTATVSGEDGSLVSRASLGDDGRKFVDAQLTSGATRAYVGLDAAGDERARVLLAVQEWVRLGGLQRSAVLVVVPTGSGWVNTPAVQAAEAQAGGDVGSLVVQYAARASWLELLLDRGRATRVAAAVVDAVQDVLARVLAAHRPQLVLFGESLGADAVAAVTGPGVAACLAAGRPGADLPWSEATSCTDVDNADDPVAAWSPDLLFTSVGGRGWVPVVTFWRVSAQLLVALDQGVGRGHSYLGSVADDWAGIWPRATSVTNQK